jgi:cell division protease FtsH
MSKKLGYVTFERERKPLFMDLGPSFGGAKDYSEETAREIDDEIKGIVDEAREKVQTMLSEKKSLLHKVARTLLEKETIEGNELRELISNHSNESDEHEAH